MNTNTMQSNVSSDIGSNLELWANLTPGQFAHRARGAEDAAARALCAAGHVEVVAAFTGSKFFYDLSRPVRESIKEEVEAALA
jgi:hypothetical protein